MVIDPYPSLPGAQFRPAAEQGDAAQAADGLQIGFALLDEGGKICRCSEAFARSFGRSSPEKITGLELSALHPALSDIPVVQHPGIESQGEGVGEIDAIQASYCLHRRGTSTAGG